MSVAVAMPTYEPSRHGGELSNVRVERRDLAISRQWLGHRAANCRLSVLLRGCA